MGGNEPKVVCLGILFCMTIRGSQITRLLMTGRGMEKISTEK